MKRIFLTLFIFQFTVCVNISAQEVYEDHHAEIYPFLARFAQKGFLQFDDQIRPVTRTYILACLDTLNTKSNQLSQTEKKELQFYLQEFNALRSNKIDESGKVYFFKKDDTKRWRFLYTQSTTASLFFDPIVSFAQVTGTNKNYNSRSTGVHIWGTIGKHLGYQIEYNDITEKGTGYDTSRVNNNETGVILKQTGHSKSQNFTEIRGSINYSFKNGSIAVGQDHLLFGYGENGRIILSDKAPNYPFIRLDYQLFPWLHFNYAHAWLNSLIVDSSLSYNNGNLVVPVRNIYIPKYMATHSIQIKAMKGLFFSLGESIIYSDNLNIGYLIPIIPFKLYDNNINNNTLESGSNSQLFLSVSSRNQLKNTHLYGNLFIDEIRLSTLFDPKKSRNQFGYTLGASITDFPIPYLSFQAEYTRINPFVYSNVIASQTYTNYKYPLGDWIGNNADRLILSLKYTPLPKLKLQARYQTIRRGDSGTIADQYYQEPQPSFLFGTITYRNEIYLSCQYELIHKLVFQGIYSKWNDIGSSFKLGFSYGL